MADVLVAGEALIDVLPEGTGAVDEVRYVPRVGGAAANVAVALARLGAPPAFFTALATDPFGDALSDRLLEEGVGSDLLHRDEGARTTLAFVRPAPDGEPAFTFYRERGADTRLPVDGVPDDRLAAVEWVHCSGVPLADEPSRTALLDLARRARARGCTVSFDPNVRPSLWTSEATMRAVLRGAITLADVVFASDEDLRAIGEATDAGEGPVGTARWLHDLGPHTVVVTRGDAGAVAVGTEASPLAGVHRHPGFEVGTVETTGAGDAFAAAVIRALVGGADDPEAVLGAANATAAVTTTDRGAVAALTGSDRVRSLHEPLPWR